MVEPRAAYGIEWSAPVSLVGDDLLRWRGRLCAPPQPRKRRAGRVAAVTVALALTGGASYTVVPGELGATHDVRLVPTTSTPVANATRSADQAPRSSARRSLRRSTVPTLAGSSARLLSS